MNSQLIVLAFFAVLATAMCGSLYYPGASYVSGAYAPLASAYAPVSAYSPLASSYSSVVSSYSPLTSYLGYQPALSYAPKSYYGGVSGIGGYSAVSGIGGYSAYAYPYGVKYV